MATEKRLIDANELAKDLADDRDQDCNRYQYWYQKEERDARYNFAIDRVNEAPTVDAVEVVHGRWVIEKRHTVSRNPYMDDNYHAHATCSECGFCIHSENASFGYPKMNTTNYCPNCGAKMDGDDDDK